VKKGQTGRCFRGLKRVPRELVKNGDGHNEQEKLVVSRTAGPQCKSRPPGMERGGAR